MRRATAAIAGGAAVVPAGGTGGARRGGDVIRNAVLLPGARPRVLGSVLAALFVLQSLAWAPVAAAQHDGEPGTGSGAPAAGHRGAEQEGVSHAEAKSAAGEHPSLMQVNPGLMVWTVVTFVALLVVLRFTAWKPLLASLDARERRIREAVEGAERAREQSEELLAQHRRLLDQAKEEAHKIIDEGKADGLKLRHEIAAQARAEAEEFKARAKRELELATDQARKELWIEATRLSTDLAEKILARSLGDADRKRLVERALEEIRTTRAE